MQRGQNICHNDGRRLPSYRVKKKSTSKEREAVQVEEDCNCTAHDCLADGNGVGKVSLKG